MNAQLLIGLAVLAAAPVAAQDIPAPAIDTSSILAAPQPAAAPSPFGDTAIGDAGLGRIAGREDVQQLQQIAQTRNSSTVSNNKVGANSVTGTISIDGSAFQNLTGLAVISANTGNNVSINAAMNVNVAIRP